MGFDEARHLLSRTAFGATPAEIRAFEAQDYAPPSIGCWPTSGRTAITPAPGWIDEGPAEVRRAAAGRRGRGQGDRRRRQAAAVERPVQEQGRELRNWWIEEMLVTDQPLVERMVLFWHNHFTSSLQKVRYPRRRCSGRTRCSAARRWATSPRC